MNKLAFGPLLIASIAAAAIISGASLKRARAAAVPQASATVKPAVAFTTSSLCHGSIALTQDSTDLPNGNLNMGVVFFTGTPTTVPKAGKPNQVTGLFLIHENASCQNSTQTSPQNPCDQGGFFTGSVALGATKAAPNLPNVMTLAFTDSTAPFQVAHDPLDGCQATFSVVPMVKNTQAYFVSSGPIAQNLASGSPHCPAVGTSLAVGCQAIKE